MTTPDFIDLDRAEALALRFLELGRERIVATSLNRVAVLGACALALNNAHGQAYNAEDPFAVGRRFFIHRGGMSYALMVGDTPLSLDGVRGWDAILSKVVDDSGKQDQWSSEHVHREAGAYVARDVGNHAPAMFEFAKELDAIAQQDSLERTTAQAKPGRSAPRL